ncbi:MAG TPA: tRNA uridine-5-carboxymethylaminomethyl(34) synthesis GTPase MnmE [Anaerolineae bacterium]|nr:tRNA uridine-5-carboxymethylaminomethyl(34) synthesis GTPase MnmE [Anaerolineae bacterium]
MVSLGDTIAAISTAIGEGGIGIVRMTGPDSPSILAALFRPATSPTARQRTPFIPYHLHYGHIVEPGTGEVVDQVLAVHMPAPRTYTRQDVVEIDGHGGIVALRRILELCLRQGARLAEPGEFTARAFLNGRLDLAQAEAVLDVVRAKTDRSLQAAIGQLTGRLSGEVHALRTTLLGALSYLEASLDFPEDEIPAQDIEPQLEQATAGLGRLLADADRGIIFRQGVRAAIVGRPNVGKSSLLNRLLRTNRAIVTDTPGTTRDTLEETLNLEGVPVVLVDTAGIASPQNEVEALGIERSRAALAEAGLALLVLEAGRPPDKADLAIAALAGTTPAIVVLNKVDLVRELPEAGLAAGMSCGLDNAPVLPVSALTGVGMERLEHAMVEAVLAGQATGTAPAVTHPRHKEALGRALHHVEEAQRGYRCGLAAELVAIDLSAAVHALGEITGETAGTDLLGGIFGTFCVGK